MNWHLRPALERPGSIAIISFFLLATLLCVHVVREKQGDITRIYYLTQHYYERLPLADVYSRGEVSFEIGPYDTVYSLSNAVDPLVTQTKKPLFRRVRRMLYSWTGWGLAFGDPGRIFYTLPLAQLLGVAGAVFAVARLLESRGRSTAWALLYSVSLGVGVCTIRPLTDAFATSLAIIGLCEWYRGRENGAAVGFGLAVMARETTILLPGVLILHAFHTKNRGAALKFMAALIPAGLWWLYTYRLSTTRLEIARNSFDWPFAAIGERLIRIGSNGAGFDELALLGSLIGGVAIFIAPRPYWDAPRVALAFFVLLAILTGKLIWVEFWAFGRVHMMVPALALVIFAAHGRRCDLVAPVLSALAGALLWADAV